MTPSRLEMTPSRLQRERDREIETERDDPSRLQAERDGPFKNRDDPIKTTEREGEREREREMTPSRLEMDP